MSGLYTSGAAALAEDVDWTATDLRVILTTSSYTPDADHAFVDDVTNELSGGNYARTVLATRTITVDTVNDRAVLDAADTVFTALQAAAGTPGYAVVYVEEGGSDAARRLICWVSLTGAATPTGADYTIAWASTGIAWLTYTTPVPSTTAAAWLPLDLSGGVESDPNNYATLVGDAAGRIAFTVAAGLGVINTNYLVGVTTARPCALDVDAPADWDPATEDLWLRVAPADVDLASNKRLGVAAALFHNGSPTTGPGVYESSSNIASAVLISTGGPAATASLPVGTLCGGADGLCHLIPLSGAYRMPVFGTYETPPSSAVSGPIGSVTGATGLTVAGPWTVRVILMHGGSGTTVAGGEVVEADVFYARVPRPTGP